jgi:hypothetical protein
MKICGLQKKSNYSLFAAICVLMYSGRAHCVSDESFTLLNSVVKGFSS